MGELRRKSCAMAPSTNESKMGSVRAEVRRKCDLSAFARSTSLTRFGVISLRRRLARQAVARREVSERRLASPTRHGDSYLGQPVLDLEGPLAA